MVYAHYILYNRFTEDNTEECRYYIGISGTAGLSNENNVYIYYVIGANWDITLNQAAHNQADKHQG